MIGQSFIKRILRRLRPPTHAVWRGAEMVEKDGYEQALSFISANGDAKEINAANLIKANRDIDSELDWCRHVNQYLTRFNLTPISLESGTNERFLRIKCDVDHEITSGPLVSIIMPVFNGAKTIEHAVNSILRQTWKNIEVIIVDDASTDDTWPILRRIADRDKRVKILKNNVNVGPYVSKNQALNVVTGDFVTGHDADDWAHPERIERQITSMLHDGSSASIIYMLRFSQDGVFTQFMRVGKTSPDGALRLASISCMFDVKAMRSKLGYWDCVRFAGDSELIERARIVYKNKFSTFHQMGTFCLDAEGSLTNDTELGVSKTSGISPIRKEYRGAWMKWHTTLNDKNAYLAYPPKKRYFKAGEKMLVDAKTISLLNN